MSLDTDWKQSSFVAIDLETSGSLPIGDHICEIGAVKWENGKVVDEFQTLIKPPVVMSDFIIGIHNITNEMVKDSPLIEDKIHDLHKFIQGSYLVAHHAPFDIGFLTYEFEKNNIFLPQDKVFCTSLFARKAVSGTVNHKLQTLIKHFNIDGGQAHRAKDDAMACLEVMIKCFEMFDGPRTIQQLFDYQKTILTWSNFSMQALERRHTYFTVIFEAIKQKNEIELYYAGGSKPGTSRIVLPAGVVRSPNGDYVAAFEIIDNQKSDQTKRYYLNKIQDAGFLVS
jgi:DNA polymerase-3 subunit epsilon